MPSRRRVLVSIGTIGTTAIAGCVGRLTTDPGTIEQYPWPTSGADHQNSRAVTDGVAPRENPTVEWRVDLEAPLANGEPIVTDSTVLVTTGRDIVAFDRENKTRRWSVDPDNQPYRYSGAPAVHDGVAYIPEERTLTARDLDSGEHQWSHAFDRVFDRSSPVVRERGETATVYAAAGNAVKAIDGDTGELQWEQDLDGIVRTSIAYTPRGLYVTTSGGELYAIDRSGFVAWRRTIEAGIETAPVAINAGGVVVGTGEGTIQQFDSQGRREWETTLTSFIEDGLAIAHQTLLVCSGSTLYALNPSNGRERWRVNVGDVSRNPPIVVGDSVYVGGDRLHGFDIGGGYGVRTYRVGAKRFERTPPGSVSFLTAADGKLFVTTDVGQADAETAELVVYSESDG